MLQFTIWLVVQGWNLPKIKRGIPNTDLNTLKYI